MAKNNKKAAPDLSVNIDETGYEQAVIYYDQLKSNMLDQVVETFYQRQGYKDTQIINDIKQQIDLAITGPQKGTYIIRQEVANILKEEEDIVVEALSDKKAMQKLKKVYQDAGIEINNITKLGNDEKKKLYENLKKNRTKVLETLNIRNSNDFLKKVSREYGVNEVEAGALSNAMLNYLDKYIIEEAYNQNKLAISENQYKISVLSGYVREIEDLKTVRKHIERIFNKYNENSDANKDIRMRIELTGGISGSSGHESPLDIAYNLNEEIDN